MLKTRKIRTNRGILGRGEGRKNLGSQKHPLEVLEFGTPALQLTFPGSADPRAVL